MYYYIEFDFNFTFNKAMKVKVPGVLGDPLSARVAQILITALYTFQKYLLNDNVGSNIKQISL